MGIIKKLKGKELVGWNGDPEVDIYPISSTSAIYDSDNNSLDSILASLKRGTGNTTVINLGGSTIINPSTPLENSVYPVTYLWAFCGAKSDSNALSKLAQKSRTDVPSGWSSSSNVTLNEGDALYMTTARKLGSTYLYWNDSTLIVWSVPVRIGTSSTTSGTWQDTGGGSGGSGGLSGQSGLDGQSGQNGAPGPGYNYIFCRREKDSNGEPPAFSSFITVEAVEEAWKDGYGIKYDANSGIVSYSSETWDVWYDHALGISELYPYEWQVIFEGNDSTGWTCINPTDYYGNYVPILVHNWGTRGTDGDGIEYIFYSAAKDELAPVLIPPYTGRLGEEGAISYNDVAVDSLIYLEDDFIPSGWHDEYIEPTEERPYTYVSMRKKEWANASEESTKLYGAFSDPKVFSGFTSNGYSMTLTNDSAVIDDLVNNRDLISATKGTIKVYHGELDITSDCILSIVDSTLPTYEDTNGLAAGILETSGTYSYSILAVPRIGGQQDLAWKTQYLVNNAEFLILKGVYSYVLRALLKSSLRTIAEKRFTLTVAPLTVDGSIYKLLITNDTQSYTNEGVRESNIAPTLIALRVKNGITNIPIEGVTSDPNSISEFQAGKFYILVSSNALTLVRNNDGTYTITGNIPYSSNGYLFTLYEGKAVVGGSANPQLWDLEEIDCLKAGRQGDAAVVSGYILTSDNDVVIADDNTIAGFPSLAKALFTLDNPGETFTPYFKIADSPRTTIPQINIGGTDLDAYTPSINSSTGELTYVMNPNITNLSLPNNTSWVTMVDAYIVDEEGDITFSGDSNHYRKVQSRKQTILIKDFSNGESFKIVVIPNTIGLYADGTPKRSYGLQDGITVGYIAIDNIDTNSDTLRDVSNNFISNLEPDVNIELGTIVYTITPITTSGNGTLLSNRLTININSVVAANIIGYQYDLYIKASYGYQIVDSETVDIVRDGQRGEDGKSGYVLTCDNDVVIADDDSVLNFNDIGSAVFTLQGTDTQGVLYDIDYEESLFPSYNDVPNVYPRISTNSKGEGILEYDPEPNVEHFTYMVSVLYYTKVRALLPDPNGTEVMNGQLYKVVATRNQNIQIKNFSNGTAYKLLVTPNTINLFNDRTPDLGLSNSISINVEAICSPVTRMVTTVPVSRRSSIPENNQQDELFYIIRENSENGNIISGTLSLAFSTGTAIPQSILRYIFELYLTYSIEEEVEGLTVQSWETTLVDTETLDLTSNGKDAITYDVTITPAILYLTTDRKPKKYFSSLDVKVTSEGQQVSAGLCVLSDSSLTYVGAPVGITNPSTTGYAYTVHTVSQVEDNITKTQWETLFGFRVAPTYIELTVLYYEITVYRRYTVHDYFVIKTLQMPIIMDGEQGPEGSIEGEIKEGTLIVDLEDLSNPMFKFDYSYVIPSTTRIVQFVFHDLNAGQGAYGHDLILTQIAKKTGEVHLILGKNYMTESTKGLHGNNSYINAVDTSILSTAAIASLYDMSTGLKKGTGARRAEEALRTDKILRPEPGNSTYQYVGDPGYFQWIYCNKVTVNCYSTEHYVTDPQTNESVPELVWSDTVYRTGTEGHYFNADDNSFVSVYSVAEQALNAANTAAQNALSAWSQIVLTSNRIDLAVTGGTNLLSNSQFISTNGNITNWQTTEQIANDNIVIQSVSLGSDDNTLTFNSGNALSQLVTIESGNWYRLSFNTANYDGLAPSITKVRLYGYYDFPIEKVKLNGSIYLISVSEESSKYFTEILIPNNSTTLKTNVVDFKISNSIPSGQNNSNIIVMFSAALIESNYNSMILYRPLLSVTSTGAIDVEGGSVDVTANNFRVTNNYGNTILGLDAAGNFSLSGTVRASMLYPKTQLLYSAHGLTIDLSSNPASCYQLYDSAGIMNTGLTLPSALNYVGLELSFFAPPIGPNSPGRGYGEKLNAQDGEYIILGNGANGQANIVGSFSFSDAAYFVFKAVDMSELSSLGYASYGGKYAWMLIQYSNLSNII